MTVLRASRRSLLRWLAGATAAVTTGAMALPARSQPRTAQGSDGFPQRPVTLWVPWPAGGGTDLTMRVLAELASHHLGQTMVVDNRAGAGGTLVTHLRQASHPAGNAVRFQSASDPGPPLAARPRLTRSAAHW